MKAGEEVKTYENKTFEEDDIQGAIIDNCILRNISLKNTYGQSCYFFNMKIRSSTLQACIIFDCRWDKMTRFSYCQLITELLAFRRFPAEVRALIFREVVEWNTGLCSNRSSRMPALIIALRGDPTLYQEALRPFYKTNKFVYFGPNGLHKHRNAPVLGRIDNLIIPTLLAAANFCVELSRLKSLRSIYVECFDQHSLLIRALPWWFNEFGTIQEFSIEVRDEAEDEEIVEKINIALGFTSRSTYQSLGRFVPKPCGFHCIGSGPGYGMHRALAKSQTARFYQLGPLYAIHTWQAQPKDILYWNV
ncbi:hypothetical protein N431DRAFT_363591, partial [Stipitochalara longipes BDJ]